MCSQADKIKALEDAGVVVTPSPAKIGVTMEKIFKEKVSLRVVTVCCEHLRHASRSPECLPVSHAA
jgi:hypothetical protein